MSLIQPISTKLGIINGRDAIYLDEQKFIFPIKLIFTGKINGRLCTNNSSGHRWFAYELTFDHVRAYDCRLLERCEWETVSSFDEVKNSSWISEMKLGNEYHHYLLSTYDHIYRIIAKDFELKITGYR